jgi:hypothetical protein
MRYASTLGIVLGAFGLYHMLAVPALEHAVPEVLDDIAHLEPYQPPVQRFQPLLVALFPEGSWERGDVRVLKTREMLLVVGSHESLAGGKLRVRPVSIVLCDKGLDPLLSASPDIPLTTRIWTVRAPGGAVLQFDSDVQLEKGGVGKLVSGVIQGQVTVRGHQPRQPNEPAIELLADSLEFDGKRLFSDSEVNLQWGSSQITGRDLTILLRDPEDHDRSRLPGTRETSLESLSFSQLKRLHLVLPQEILGDLATSADPTEPVRLDAGSDGPLHIDFTRGLADLRDGVWLTHTRTDGGQDDLRCDRAVVEFKNRSPTGNPTPDGGHVGLQMPAMKLSRISLAGSPVLLTVGPGTQGSVPRSGLRSLRLEGAEVHHSPGGTEGVRIVGAGQLQMELENEGLQSFVAQWKNGLVWHRLNSEEVVVLEDGAKLQLNPVGSLAGQVIRASFHCLGETQIAESTAGGSRQNRFGKIVPRSLSAKGNVRAQGPGFDANTEQLEIEVRQSPPVASSSNTEDKGPRMGYARPEQGPRPASSAAPKKTIQVQAGRIAVDLLVGGESPRIDSVSIQGKMRAVTVPLDTARESPAELRAESLDARDLASGKGAIILRGAPAQVRAKQIDLLGGIIHLEQATNRCWMEGPGSATLPLPASLAQKMPSYPPVATVTWRNGLDFDGQTLTCHDEVTVRGPMQLMRCPQFAIALDRKIPFTEAPTNLGNCNLATTTASGGVFVENRNVDVRGTRSIDQAQLQSLTISHADGMVKGIGPGWLQSVSVGTPMSPGGATSATGTSGTGLTLVQVQFQGGLRGNLRRRHVQIANQVRAIYSPVNDWSDRVDPNQPGGLPAEAIVLHCEEMDAIQNLVTPPGMGAYELSATGNTTIEGRSFKAMGHRVSYDKGKDLMVLEGTDRAYAKLWYQDPKGDRTLENSAKKIEYWPKRNIVKGEVNYLEFTTKGN